MKYIENNVCTQWRTVSALMRGLFWCLFPEYKHQNNTPVSTETVCHESTYIILFLTRHNKSKNDDKNNDLYTSSRVSLTQFSFCWWRHNRLLMTPQWPNNCGGITWIVISNSLDIDFIHGDLRGWSCKKLCFVVILSPVLVESSDRFAYVLQDCFTDTGAIMRLPQCQWSNPEEYLIAPVLVKESPPGGSLLWWVA